MDREETYKTALAALLHDLGKFWQRAGRGGTHFNASAAFVDEFSHLFPYDWLDDIRDGAGNHHQAARKEIERIVKVADWLASQERKEEDIPQSDPARTPLLPVAARVEFREPKPQDWQRWSFHLEALKLEDLCILPTTEVQVSPEDYRHLWERFESELRQPGRIDSYFGLIGFLALLRKYASFVPSATPWEADEEYRTLPDISLYDHLKVACAIAVCLALLLPDHLEGLLRRSGEAWRQPVARLLRADFSGIQNFLYRITRAEPTAEFRNTAKRLRGRSFFLTLLADVVADWLARELALLPANILFCGGGRFDLLIGADEATKQKLDELNQYLQRWLISEFHGELGIQIATVDVLPADFEDLKRAFDTLDDKLARKKQQKFRDTLDASQFFVTTEPLYHVCNYCHVTPLPDPEAEPCLSCRLQRDLGGKLPRTEYLAYLYGNGKDFLFSNGAIVDFAEPFGVRVALLRADEAKQMVRWADNRPERIVLYRLNNTDFLDGNYPSNVSCGFKFFGNATPIAKQQIAPNPVKADKEPIDPDEVLDFDEVAFMSSGARLLGC